MNNNTAERAMRPVVTRRRNWTLAGSDEGGRQAAAIYTLIETAKLDDVDPVAWHPLLVQPLRPRHPPYACSPCRPKLLIGTLRLPQ